MAKEPDLPPHRTTEVDVLLLAAVKDERDVVLRLEADWKEETDASGFTFHIRSDRGGLRWALARATDMGPEYSSNVGTRLVAALKPRCLAMVGVCAGWREKVQLGDVVVAERLFRYDAGKLRALHVGGARTEEVFHDIRTYNMDARWRQRAEDFPANEWTGAIHAARPVGYAPQETWLLGALDASERVGAAHPRDLADRQRSCPDWTEVVTRLEARGFIAVDGGLKLTDAGRTHVHALRERYPDGPPAERGVPQAKVGPMATGSRVVEDDSLFPTIHRHERKTLAVDMEGFAVAAVAEIEGVEHCLVAKGVQDYADLNKDDRYRQYAIEASYRFVAAFLRRHLTPAGHPAPFIVPQHEATSFTGREDELKALERALLDEAAERICTIAGVSGAGGIGKSALAVHFATVYRDRFPGGVVGLRVDGKHIDAIAREFARSVGEPVDPDDDRDAGSIMQAIFAARRMLLIFDNAEDAAIRQLRPGGRCAVIVTTRDRGLPVLLDVPPAARVDVPVLPPTEGVALLRKLVGARVDAEPDAAVRLVEVVGSLPLALQIVGAILQIESWRTLESLAESLATERERLRKLSVRGDPHLDVRVSFSVSLRLLRPEEIDFLACLSVCAADGFSPQTAAVVTDCEGALVSDRLAYLHRLSLVNRRESAAIRFVLHPLLRDFARELAETRGLFPAAATRHAHHFLALLKTNASQESRAAAPFPADDIDEAVLAADWMIRHNEIDQTIVIGLQELMQRAGYWREATELIPRLARVADANGDKDVSVQLRIQQSKFLQLRGDFLAADEILKGIIDDSNGQTHLTPRVEAMVLNSLGGVLQRLGKFDEAAEALRRSHELLTAYGDERGQAMVLNSLGGVLQRLGKFEEAAEALRESGEIEEGLGNERGQAMVLNSLGGVLQRLGQFEAAAEALRKSGEIEEGLGNERGQAMVLNSLGGVLQRLGKFEEAADALRRSLAISEELKDARSLAMVFNSLGGVLQRLGKFEEAADALRRSLAISEELKDARSLAMVFNSLGGVLQRLGKFEEAADVLGRSHELLRAQGDERGQAMVLNSLGGVLQRLGKFEEAADALRRSLAISEELKDARSLAMVFNSLGGVLQRLSKFEEAADVLRKSVSIGEHLNDRRHLAIVLNSLGGVLQRLGKFEESADALRRSYKLLRAQGDERGQAMVLNSLGGVLERLGKGTESEAAFQESISIGERLHDRIHLAKARTAFGKALLARGALTTSLDQLRLGFELDLASRNAHGLGIVTPVLVDVLRQTGAASEANEVIRRAIAAAPDKRSLQRLDSVPAHDATTTASVEVCGRIKRLLEPLGRPRFGFVKVDDVVGDIYFSERRIPGETFSRLTVGMSVVASVIDTARGREAITLRISDGV